MWMQCWPRPRWRPPAWAPASSRPWRAAAASLPCPPSCSSGCRPTWPTAPTGCRLIGVAHRRGLARGRSPPRSPWDVAGDGSQRGGRGPGRAVRHLGAGRGAQVRAAGRAAGHGHAHPPRLPRDRRAAGRGEPRWDTHRAAGLAGIIPAGLSRRLHQPGSASCCWRSWAACCTVHDVLGGRAQAGLHAGVRRGGAGGVRLGWPGGGAPPRSLACYTAVGAPGRAPGQARAAPGSGESPSSAWWQP